MGAPLVSVICLCYNHSRFVRESLQSVFGQTYDNIQLVVIDDASSDGSADVIRDVLSDHPNVIFMGFEKNIGNCRAFNKGLALASGEFIIDLAADDVLYPQRVEEGVRELSARGKSFGVNFSDAELISETGELIGFHSKKYPHDTIPQGNVYKDVISRYFINSPTMIIRTEVFRELGGYDETLAYEDFDFWVRSARNHLYCYTAHPLIKRRIVGTSMTRQQYKRNSPQLLSTYKVCLKIKTLNRTTEEDKALRKRAFYEMRKAIAVGEIGLAFRYGKLILNFLW